ncbi:MAG: GNAT family N-acetyltransferase [Deltaproteobacteria bacterium]|nr:GNAT family N-acetyltransferase [Deltaproteobacteria bacterium]
MTPPLAPPPPGSPSPRPPGLTLRTEVRSGDAPGVEALVRDTGFFTPDEVAVARELVDAYLTQGPSSGYRFLFAESPRGLAGYTCYGEIPATERRYDLYWIAVSATQQRGGIGRLLLRESEALIAQAGGTRVYIETSSRALYTPTQAFYTNNGYILEARLKQFYTDADDKLIYVKAL